MPLVDLAYQGFGDGLEPDAAGLRHMAAEVPELMLAVSCSKNFGLYRDRVGAAFVLSADKAASEVARSNLFSLNRLNFSFPPDHGAKVVATILGDPGSRPTGWPSSRTCAHGCSTCAAASPRRCAARPTPTASTSWRRHRGMFSRLGASPEQVRALRDEHGIYMVGDSRVNVAGLPADGLDKLARALVAVGA